MATNTKTTGKRGRPTLPPGEGKRVPLNMRTTEKLRDWVEAEAKKSGRSLAQEVEFRPQHSQWVDASMTRLGQVLALVVRQTEEFHGKRFEDDAEVRRQTSINLREALNALAGAAISFGTGVLNNFDAEIWDDGGRTIVLRFEKIDPDGQPAETATQFLRVDYG